MEDGVDNATGNFLETKADDSEGRKRSASTGSNGGGHKRSFSGSLLSRLSFLRMSQVNEESTDNVGKGQREVDGLDADEGSGGGGVGGGTTSSVIQRRQSLRKTRRRKGSLRKTALLGTSGREKRSVASRSLEVSADDAGNHDDGGYGSNADSPSQLAIDTVSSAATPRPMYETQQSGWPLPETTEKPPLHEQEPLTAGRSFIHRNTTTSNNNNNNNIGSLSHLNTNNTASTTSLSSLNDTTTGTSSVTSCLPIPTPSSSSESYFSLHNNNKPTSTTTTSNMSLRPRPSVPHAHRPKSPLATHSVEGVPPPTEIWDYSETEWWGWIILLVTWLVFVVGMGSCFEVWSWAWDVGETPYAPPELEDDPTLPIVGYYPALIILTAVMAWVWVVVAWVGMKYFRHANISGEES